jgi:hypothetical protein
MGEKHILRTMIVAGALLAAGSASVVSTASAQSLTDRFKGLFGGKSDEPAQNAAPATPATPTENQIADSCPPVSIRAGASTYAVAAPGKEATGNDVRFQVTISKTARDCRLSGGEIVARIGIQGRVIAGPAGAPASVDIPVRIAVVQGGVSEKVIATKAYRTTVAMAEDESVPFTLVADDLAYPVPAGGVGLGDNYIFYIGFDPQSLAPAAKAKATKKKK